MFINVYKDESERRLFQSYDYASYIKHVGRFSYNGTKVGLKFDGFESYRVSDD